MKDGIFSLAALLSLVPVSIIAVRRPGVRDGLFWILLGVAVVGPAVWAYVQMADGWRTGLSTTLWITVAVTMGLFAVTAMVSRHGWRLAPLVGPYMMLLCAVASVWVGVSGGRGLLAEGPGGWVALHIAISIFTYSLVTLAALAAFAAFLQDRALKNKHPTALTRLLPSVVDCERLVFGLLALGEAVLGLGLVTGMATLYLETGNLVAFDHKTVLTSATFIVLGGLLLAHWRSGLKGRMVARSVLLAYLLLTLGYPGVKFVTDVIIG